MAIYFSKSLGFQNTETHGQNIALGAYELSPEEYRSLLDGQTIGKPILIDHEGRPYSGAAYQVSLADAKVEKINEMNRLYEQKVALLQEGASSSEVRSWTEQKAEAIAYLNDPINTPAPMLRAIAVAREMDLKTLAVKIIQKAENYSAEHGLLMGRRQVLEKRITEADSIKRLNFIIWSKDDLKIISS